VTFTIPNQGTASFITQAAPDATDIAALAAAPALTGVISGCGVTANGSTLVLTVAAGTARAAGRLVTVAGGTVTITTADATNPRRDIVTVNTSGTLAITAGTPAAVTSSTGPVKPAIPASSVLLAEVYVPATGTAALSTWLVDKGMAINDPEVENVLWYGAKGDTRIVTDAAITSGLTSLTSATAAFTAADTGKSVTVAGAGAGGAQLVTTVTFVNATTVTTGVSAGTTVTNAWCSVGTNDAAALQAWITACDTTGNPGWLAGVNGSKTYYKTNTQLTISGSLITLVGGSTPFGPVCWIDGTGINTDSSPIINVAPGTLNRTAYTMSANSLEATYPMKVVTAAVPGTLASGDWIRIEDTQMAGAGEMMNGEIVQVDTVRAVAGTTTVFLRTQQNASSYLTANAAKFTSLNMLNDVVLVGIGIQGSMQAPRLVDTVQSGSGVIASSSGTTVIVASGAQFIVNQFIQMGQPNEIMKITGIAANTLTVTRAQCGSLAITAIAQGDQITILPTSAMRQTGVLFTQVLRPVVINCQFDHTQENGVAMDDCLFPLVQNNMFTDVMDYGYATEAGDTANGYAVEFSNATQWGTIISNRGLRCKFLVCMTGSTAQGGCPRSHVVNSNIAVDGFYGGFDCHSGADEIEFDGNVVDGTRQIGTGQYDGIFIDGGRVKLTNNKIRGAGRHGINANNKNALRTLRCTIENNDIAACGYYDPADTTGRGIWVETGTVDHTSENVCIRNNDIRYCGGGGIQLSGPATVANYPHSVIIQGNTVQQNAGGQPAVLLDKIGSGVVSGNHVRVDIDAYDAIRITNSTDVAVTGNTVESTVVNTSGIGLHFSGCTDITVAGNRTKKFFNSLVTDTSSDFFTITGNDLRSAVSTALTVSGTGNKIAQNIGYNPSGKWAGQPAVPASTVAATNTSNVDQQVFVNGGTVSAVAIGGVATGIGATGRDFRVPAGQTITLTYSVAPTWTWFGD
jgi:hypothetical protein